MAQARSSLMAIFTTLMAAGCLWGCAQYTSGHRESRATADASASNSANDWPAHGRDADETRFSPLGEVNSANVGQLGLAWHFALRDGRGVEATPLVVDGVMYVTSAWSIVYALDAATGRERWVYDPKVDRRTGTRACCDAVNRGVAHAAGKVFVATLDGRLVALEARTGQRVWETRTFTDSTQPYVITGAPRIARDLVIIGNSGADLGVRGYVSAYHLATGKLAWRFFTVPGNPRRGPDHAASDSVLPMMAASWTGEWWRQGGGGTVWDSITYDAELDRVYVGVGNGSPWNQQVRSPGGGDNLFLASIVALDRATGTYRWHYQTTPGDTWDATATQTMTLTRLTIAGREHRVLLQAPKNGFFYVIDRDEGRLLSAGKLVPMHRTADTPPGAPLSWAYDVDLTTGRPLENPEARYRNGTAVTVHPVGPGAHGWQPMAYSPATGLVYLPVQDFASRFQTDPNYQPRPWTRASGLETPGGLPQDAALRAKLPRAVQARLVAWNPLTQQEAWRVPQDFAGNGGVLATAGRLVFQSAATGEFVAYDAGNGSKLWYFDAQATAQGGPISYRIDGEQYIAIAVGNGGSSWLAGGLGVPALANLPTGRILAFKLGGSAAYPRIDRQLPTVPEPPSLLRDAATLKAGAKLFGIYCAGCHGFGAISGHVTPDLRRSGVLQSAEAFREVVKAGLLEKQGMPRFGDALTAEQVEQIRAWLADEARFVRSLSP
ncbi:MAG: Quinohemoprotein alcohol dehydrogenase precursor [Pseudomonadota bacterium]